MKFSIYWSIQIPYYELWCNLPVSGLYSLTRPSTSNIIIGRDAITKDSHPSENKEVKLSWTLRRPVRQDCAKV